MAYTVRGLLEVWIYKQRQELIQAARKALDGLVQCVADTGWLSGEFDQDFAPAADWVCVTGSSQIAHCLLISHEILANETYFDRAKKLNSFVRRTVQLDGEVGVRGGVKGSYPVYGDYGPFRYLNWAAKFTLDANIKEMEVRQSVS